MKSDVIKIDSGEASVQDALNQAEAVATYKRLPPKSALHMRLLTEELMGLMQSITGEKSGEFWIEDKDKVYELHLLVYTRMSLKKREQLLSASTSGKNAARRGIMGALRDMFDREGDSDVAPFTAPMLLNTGFDAPTSPALDYEWSLSRYREELQPLVGQHEQEAVEAWDELEKSVVTHVANEIKVFIRGDQVEMVLYKSF